jgi:hypothetical protein
MERLLFCPICAYLYRNTIQNQSHIRNQIKHILAFFNKLEAKKQCFFHQKKQIWTFINLANVHPLLGFVLSNTHYQSQNQNTKLMTKSSQFTLKNVMWTTTMALAHTQCHLWAFVPIICLLANHQMETPFYGMIHSTKSLSIIAHFTVWCWSQFQRYNGNNNVAHCGYALKTGAILDIYLERWPQLFRQQKFPHLNLRDEPTG